MSSCGTFRQVGDKEAEKYTGVRSMVSFCMAIKVADCLPSAIKAAKAECKREQKNYTYKSHELSGGAIVKYTCESKTKGESPNGK